MGSVVRVSTPLAPEDAVEKDPARAPVSVDEGVDGLELGVSDRRLGNGADVVPADKGDKILETALNACRGGRNEERPMRAVPSRRPTPARRAAPSERRSRRLDQLICGWP